MSSRRRRCSRHRRRSSPCCPCANKSSLPHLHGKHRFKDNNEDELFDVFLLFNISRNFLLLSIRAWDNDGEFLLIEAATNSRSSPRNTSPTLAYLNR
ncbi:unnamed protein product [Linum trigynum]|uniref:Uncharacterized protein n=1 Tax=Linum trigynum TaxID=586398 RepID=A0AAV2EQ09_9ROSI